MKHPRVWAILLIAAALPLFVVGYNFAILCYVPTVTGCFATHDATQGIAVLIIAGLIIVGAAMLLTSARGSRGHAPDMR